MVSVTALLILILSHPDYFSPSFARLRLLSVPFPYTDCPCGLVAAEDSASSLRRSSQDSMSFRMLLRGTANPQLCNSGPSAQARCKTVADIRQTHGEEMSDFLRTPAFAGALVLLLYYILLYYIIYCIILYYIILYCLIGFLDSERIGLIGSLKFLDPSAALIQKRARQGLRKSRQTKQRRLQYTIVYYIILYYIILYYIILYIVLYYIALYVPRTGQETRAEFLAPLFQGQGAAREHRAILPRARSETGGRGKMWDRIRSSRS